MPLTRAPQAGETLYYMTTAYRAIFSGSDGTAKAEAFDAVHPYQVAEEEHPSWHVGDDGRYELTKGTPASSSSSAVVTTAKATNATGTASYSQSLTGLQTDGRLVLSAALGNNGSYRFEEEQQEPEPGEPGTEDPDPEEPGKPDPEDPSDPSTPADPDQGTGDGSGPRPPERARATKAPRTPARAPRARPRPSLAQATPTGPHSPCSESQALRHARRASRSSIAASRSGSAAAPPQSMQTPPRHTRCRGGVLRIGPWPCRAGSASRASATSRGGQARRRAARRSAQKRRAPCSRPACARRRGSGPQRLHRGRAAPRRRGRTQGRRGSTQS